MHTFFQHSQCGIGQLLAHNESSWPVDIKDFVTTLDFVSSPREAWRASAVLSKERHDLLASLLVS